MEYGILLAVVAAAVMGMQFYAKRGIQGVVKVAADQLSPVTDQNGLGLGREAQVAGMQYEAGDRSHSVLATGDALEHKTETRSSVTRTIDKGSDVDGVATTGVVDDTMISRGNLAVDDQGNLTADTGDISSYTKTIVEVK